MLLNKYLTPDLYRQLSAAETPAGWTLEKTIQSGLENPDSYIGVYAGDSESYDVFSSLLRPIIEDYHRHFLSCGHPANLSLQGLDVRSLDAFGRFVVSSQVCAARNLAGYPFPPAVSAVQRREIERRLISAFQRLPVSLRGQYVSLQTLDAEDRKTLVRKKLLFDQTDRFKKSAGIYRDWPKHRGVFISADRRFCVWVSEEDTLRAAAMQPGAGLADAFGRLAAALDYLNEQLFFAYDQTLGYHASCPTNLGTGMRASVLMRLPQLSRSPGFSGLCDSLGLTIRSDRSEKQPGQPGLFDISNKQCLGISEREIFRRLYSGVRQLIEAEQSLTARPRALSTPHPLMALNEL